MGPFDLAASVRRAEQREGSSAREPARLPRSDRGRSRLDPRVLSAVAAVLSAHDRPVLAEALAEIGRRCRRARVRPPSRATVYKLLDTLPTRSYRLRDLPPTVQDALYNLAPESEVPGHQVAFCCFNYGDLAAASYASGLPWLALHQALKLPGWRSRSRGLAEAVARTRGIR
ncbi:hypothetical protein FBQ97_07075 [Acidobacteria bacterium ACD]|nr:MAG: hypothetical protein EDX89_20535 [Acidobacteriota bacterium]MDL1949559.1 hypothetical protein [Acidobacteria bacterium ACD]